MSRERVAIRPRGETVAERRHIYERGRQRGFTAFVFPEADRPEPVDGTRVVLETPRGLRTEDGTLIPTLLIGSEPELAQAVGRTPPGGTLAIDWAADRVIPLENAVAGRGRRFSLWTVAHTPAEVPGALGALEHGADLVIVDVRSPAEVDQLEALVEGPLPARLEWDVLPLRAVGPAGVGDRVIVDTTSLLRAEEGLLVGSAAAYLFHVASEAEGSHFSRPRPFRVNAGAAHSYVLMADGMTRYLSELGPGDAVLASTPTSGVRSVRVGRLKVERRPLVQLTVDDHGRDRTLFAQEAESVRLTTETGRAATTELHPGDRLRGVHLPPARHLGHPVQESIEER